VGCKTLKVKSKLNKKKIEDYSKEREERGKEIQGR